MGYAYFGLSLGFPFVFYVMVLAINFLLDFLGSDFMVTTNIATYILLKVTNYVYFCLDLFYGLTTPICLIRHFEICLDARKAYLPPLQNHQAHAIQLVTT